MTYRALVLLVLFSGSALAADARVTRASSHLKDRTRVMEWSGNKPDWRAATFKPTSAMDGSLATAWCEGARGPGIGEWIEVELDQPTRTVEIDGGFRKLSLAASGSEEVGEEQAQAWFKQSLDIFKSNGRPAVIEVLATDGKVIDRLQPGDRYFGHYSFHVPLAPGRYRLRIAQAHPGTRFEDTCISELRFHASRKSIHNRALPDVPRPLGSPWSCRSTTETSVLPREVTLLGADGGRIGTAVRNPAGLLLPSTDVGCFWGKKSKVIECVWEGEETDEEALDDASSDLPAWRGTLGVSAAATGVRRWTGEHEPLGGEPLKLEVVVDPDAKVLAPTVTATRGEAVVETTTYECTRFEEQ